MKLHRYLATLAICLLATAALAAPQEGEAPQYKPEDVAMMEAWQKAMSPGEPHAILAKRAGSFKMTITMWMSPEADPMKSEGTVEREMILDGRVLEERVSSEVMGQPFQGIGRGGYDNITGKYWNTWIDSMSTGVFLSHGVRDAESGVMTYEGEFDDPMTGSKTKVRAVIHPEEDGNEIFEWYEDKGAGENKTMEMLYERNS